MRIANTIVLASTNRHKLEEFESLFKGTPEIEIVAADGLLRNAGKLGLAEIYDSYDENALAKARLTNQGTHYPALADDSGLEVEALGGRPGVKSHRFAIPKAGVTQDRANIEQLLNELKGYPMAKRSARFVCSLALVMEGFSILAHGVLEGRIAEAPSGENGFGYDPIFIPANSQKTLAEMTDSEKNTLSHRGQAVAELMKQIKAKGIVFAKP